MSIGWRLLLAWVGCAWLLWAQAQEQASMPTDVLVWRHQPLVVTLPVGQEQILRFDEPVTFNSPEPNPALTQEQLQVTNLDRHVYARALQTFDTQRVLVRLNTSGQVVLLDLRAQAHAPHRVIHIQTPATSLSQTQTRDSYSGHWVRLIRYALHHLYAPMRLLPADPDLIRHPLPATRDLPSLAPQQPIAAKAIAQWQSMAWPLFVTAVTVRHRGDGTFTLEPRAFCGDWLAVSVFPRQVLGESGSDKDATTVFLVSQQPFAQALGRCHGQG